jgi:hypothetical protein
MTVKPCSLVMCEYNVSIFVSVSTAALSHRKPAHDGLSSGSCSAHGSINPLAYTAGCETAGLARSVNTQPAVRQSEPSMSCF